MDSFIDSKRMFKPKTFIESKISVSSSANKRLLYVNEPLLFFKYLLELYNNEHTCQKTFFMLLCM